MNQETWGNGSESFVMIALVIKHNRREKIRKNTANIN